MDSDLSTSAGKSFIKSVLLFFIGCVAVIVIGVAVLIMLYGSLDIAMARLLGNELVLVPDRVDLGKIAVGQTGATSHFTIKNVSRRTITLTGSRADCGCVEVSSLPVSLSPREQKEIAFTVEAPSEPTVISQTLVFYTDSSANPQLLGTVCGVAEN